MGKLNERAKQRLRLAASLVGGLKLDRKNFYPEMLEYLEKMPEKEKAELQKQVNWLEEYDNTERL